MGLGVKEEEGEDRDNETPAAAGEITNVNEAVKREDPGGGDDGEPMDPAGTPDPGTTTATMDPGTTEPDQGIKRNLSQGEPSKKQKLEGGDPKEGGNSGNPDIGSVFATQTWEAYFATWDCRKKARGILARSDKLGGASQSGESWNGTPPQSSSFLLSQSQTSFH